MRGAKFTSFRAFTLIEMLVACAITLALLVILGSIMSSTSAMWMRQRSQAEAFAGANEVFDTLTRTLAQATLNTYWAYDNPENPTKYLRQSELHFVMGPTSDVISGSSSSHPGGCVFFQAPLGLSEPTTKLPLALNALGFFVTFGDDSSYVPSFLSSVLQKRYRFRLCEWTQPSENFSVYQTTSTSNPRSWFATELAIGSGKNISFLADNVIGLVFLSKAGTYLSYDYDSRNPDLSAADAKQQLNQLPSRVKILMVVIDEVSAKRLAEANGASPPDVGPSPDWFIVPERFEQDLAAWEEKLKSIKPHINYRTYIATVSVANSTWSL